MAGVCFVRVAIALACGYASFFFLFSNTSVRREMERQRSHSGHRNTTTTAINATRVALLVSTRSPRGLSVEQLPLFTILLPSFRDTVQRNDSNISYEVYLGHDDDDPLLSRPGANASLAAVFRRHMVGYRASLKVIRLSGMTGAPAWVWNALAQRAYDSGCDYFYQLNDDVELHGRNWARHFIRQLRDNPIHRDVGVVGPRDVSKVHLFTQSFVGRPHLEIFTSYFPPSLKNWWSDDWISGVYTKAKSRFPARQFPIRNTNKHGTRYRVAMEGARRVRSEVMSGRERVAEWLERYKHR